MMFSKDTILCIFKKRLYIYFSIHPQTSGYSHFWNFKKKKKNQTYLILIMTYYIKIKYSKNYYTKCVFKCLFIKKDFHIFVRFWEGVHHSIVLFKSLKIYLKKIILNWQLIYFQHTFCTFSLMRWFTTELNTDFKLHYNIF